ncbi:hypothetical protein KR222_011082 [Zaprionus bogoriensis]|nr:hypothetical protein KR222_011082 [Zaprionus bogoriensis]
MNPVSALARRLRRSVAFSNVFLSTRSQQLEEVLDVNVAIREPYTILQHWLSIAQHYAPECRPRTACLATVDVTGQPVMRLTNVEQINPAGITFYTAMGGRQAGEISSNPHVSLHFHWPRIERSIHVVGKASPVCALQAERQFNKYPRHMQIGLHGRYLPQRRTSSWLFPGKFFEMIGDKITQLLGKQLQPIPMPHDWGGCLLKPTLYEFTDAGRQCMRFRRCLTLPRGKRGKTVTADCYDWVFDNCKLEVS